MRRNYYNNISLWDRVFSVATYLTIGFFGFIWLIFSHIRGTHVNNFLKFNIYQSIFISIMLYLVSFVSAFFVELLRFIIKLIGIIPFIGDFIAGGMNLIFYFTFGIGLFHYSLFELVFLALMFYLVIMSLLGKYPELPYISDKIVRRMI